VDVLGGTFSPWAARKLTYEQIMLVAHPCLVPKKNTQKSECLYHYPITPPDEACQARQRQFTSSELDPEGRQWATLMYMNINGALDPYMYTM